MRKSPVNLLCARDAALVRAWTSTTAFAPRSQVALGNAIVGATPLPQPGLAERDRQWNCLGKCVPKWSLGTRVRKRARVTVTGSAKEFAPRSQVALGNAIVSATPLPQPGLAERDRQWNCLGKCVPKWSLGTRVRKSPVDLLCARDAALVRAWTSTTAFAPRSQVALGNAIVGATPLPQPGLAQRDR